MESLLQSILVDTQVDLSSRREALVASYNSGGDLNHGRSAVLQAVADSSEFKRAVYNSSFVLMEYFGYLRRDIDQSGFEFWLNVLNNRDLQLSWDGLLVPYVDGVSAAVQFIVSHSNGEGSVQ